MKASSFIAGLKFHSVIDKVREQYIVSSGIYDLCPDSKYKTQWLKILEDRILYTFVGDWGEFSKYLNEILSEEKTLGVNEVDLKRWHSALQRYFSNKPSHKTMQGFTSELGFSKEVSDEWEDNIQKIKDNKKIIDTFRNLYQKIDSLLEEYFKDE